MLAVLDQEVLEHHDQEVLVDHGHEALVVHMLLEELILVEVGSDIHDLPAEVVRLLLSDLELLPAVVVVGNHDLVAEVGRLLLDAELIILVAMNIQRHC